MMTSPDDSIRSPSQLALDNLQAQLAPLDRYGLGGLTSVLLDGFVAPMAASLIALCACASPVGR
jgi:hypothetical protein